MGILARFAGVVSAIAFVGASTSWAQQAAPAPVSVKATIDRYCVGCHSERGKAGNLSLQGLNPDDPAAAPDVWEKVVRKLRVRYMPTTHAWCVSTYARMPKLVDGLLKPHRCKPYSRGFDPSRMSGWFS